MDDVRMRQRFQNSKKIAKFCACRKINIRVMKKVANFCNVFQTTNIDFSAAKFCCLKKSRPFERYIILIVSNGLSRILLRSFPCFGKFCQNFARSKTFAKLLLLEFYGGSGGSGRFFFSTWVPPFQKTRFYELCEAKTNATRPKVVRAPTKHVPATRVGSGPDRNRVSLKGNMFSPKGNMYSPKGNMFSLGETRFPLKETLSPLNETCFPVRETSFP